jgi:hypothetical protein
LDEEVEIARIPEAGVKFLDEKIFLAFVVEADEESNQAAGGKI